MVSPEPYLIQFSQIGERAIGFISVAEHKNIPFQMKRVYWTYDTPEDVIRGKHAHVHAEQVLIAVSGSIIVTTENRGKEKKTFTLDSPNMGLYLPPYIWHTMKYTPHSTQVILASSEFNESDYIRDYQAFINS
jgi:hypothetical protein